MSEFITAYITKWPHTFHLRFDWWKYVAANPERKGGKFRQTSYGIEVMKIFKKIEEAGLTPMIKRRYKRNSTYFITFRSKHDAMAFKLGWT